MKNKILIPILIAGAIAAFLSFRYSGRLPQSSESKRILTQDMVMKAVNNFHFSPRTLDDSFSVHVFKRIISMFDGDKHYFLKGDMKTLNAYQFKIDDEIREHSIEFFDSLDDIYLRRIAFVKSIYADLLSKPFDFTTNERYEYGDKVPYPENETALKERWRLILKSAVLGKYEELKDEQEKKKENKDSVNAKFKTNGELEADAREDVTKLYQRYFKRMDKIKDDDRFNAYINAITYNEDPHTDYFPPAQKKNFDASMSGSFVGIGAKLNESIDEKITIVEIIPGTPSAKQGELKAGDEILKVAQGDKPPVDIRGFELDDVVQLIRGQKGTEVRLTVKRADGTNKVIKIIRDVVTTEETFAKSAIIKTDEGAVGYIKLPSFYGDFNGTSHRKSSVDIQKEVIKLKAEGVNGIIIDLRDNGGGSLGDVVDMTGIFVGRGPAVQVRGSHGTPTALVSRADDTALYTGPLIVMVNEGSASASEILAAALQDYKRAVIVGTPTYGKGTVQKMVSLDELLDPMTRIQLENDTTGQSIGAVTDPPGSLGSVKLTEEKFYRVSGGSTQQKGVYPDVMLPDGNDFEDEDLGERHNKSSLPWDKIAEVNYRPTNSAGDLKALSDISKNRVSNNPVYKQRLENAAKYKKMMQEKYVSLNEQQYKKDQKEREEMSKMLDTLQKSVTPLRVVNPDADMMEISADSVKMSKNKDWLKNIGKNTDLIETIKIMNDLHKMEMTLNNKKY